MKKSRILLLFISCTILSNSMNLIKIETQSTGLYLSVSPDKKVSQAYFGRKLNSTSDFEKILYTKKSPLNLTGRDAYSFWGNGNIQELALQAIHADGNMTSDLRYVSQQDIPVSADITETIVELKDSLYPFIVKLHYKAYYSTDILEIWTEIVHNEKKSVRLDKISSGLLYLDAPDYYLTQFSGEWADEMQMTEEKLVRGIKSLETKKGVRTTQSENPGFILSLNSPMQENTGEVLLGALSWSGNFKFTFQVDQFNKLTVIGGVNNFNSAYLLEPGKPFVTPALVLAYSNQGSGKSTRNLHTWARNNVLRDGNTVRPVILNSWEGAFFDFDEKKLTGMMDGAAELGVEIFVLDDGWFGNKYPRNNDKMGLGDWQVNNKKLPRGISYLSDYALSKGLKFGIWIEPEMISPKSELAEKHPEWIVGSGSNREQLTLRNQLILDLTNPKVQDYIFGVIDKLLAENKGISYIKWDANAHIQNFGSTWLKPENQSNFFIDYVKGLYSIYNRLMIKYPSVIVQACSSGGGRVDFGSMKYHHEFWASDNTDALSRAYIQWGTNYFYPAMATAAHVTKVPNHQTGRTTPLKMRIDMAMTGRMGVELQPSDLSATDLVFLKKSIETYKRIRGIIQLGDLYRLVSPYQTKRSALMYVNPEKSKAVVFAFSLDNHYRNEPFKILLNGLDPTKKYLIKEINQPNDFISNKAIDHQVFHGDFLMKFGLNITLGNEGESVAYELTEEIQ